METLNVPLFPVGQDEGEYLVFLPGVETERIDELAYDVDSDKNVLDIHCVYGEENGEPVGQTYTIEINEVNRDQIENLQRLAVLNPNDMEPSELTDDPEAQDELETLFEHLRGVEQT